MVLYFLLSFYTNDVLALSIGVVSTTTILRPHKWYSSTKTKKAVACCCPFRLQSGRIVNKFRIKIHKNTHVSLCVFVCVRVWWSCKSTVWALCDVCLAIMPSHYRKITIISNSSAADNAKWDSKPSSSIARTADIRRTIPWQQVPGVW